jgi:hypothetical protein
MYKMLHRLYISWLTFLFSFMLLGVAGVISPCLGNDLDDILRSHSYFEPILHFLQEKGLLEKGEPEKIVGWMDDPAAVAKGVDAPKSVAQKIGLGLCIVVVVGVSASILLLFIKT